jgi:hypothetical protein
VVALAADVVADLAEADQQLAQAASSNYFRKRKPRGGHVGLLNGFRTC